MNRCGFRFCDKEYRFRTAKETYLNALRVIKKKYPDLYSILGHIKNTKDLGYFVKSPNDVYIKSPELNDRAGSIEELEAGWYTTTILSNREKETILLYACGVAGVKYFDELEIWFDGGNNKYTPLSKVEADHHLNEFLAQL